MRIMDYALREKARKWLYNADYPNEVATQGEVDDLNTLLTEVRDEERTRIVTRLREPGRMDDMMLNAQEDSATYWADLIEKGVHVTPGKSDS